TGCVVHPTPVPSQSAATCSRGSSPQETASTARTAATGPDLRNIFPAFSAGAGVVDGSHTRAGDAGAGCSPSRIPCSCNFSPVSRPCNRSRVGEVRDLVGLESATRPVAEGEANHREGDGARGDG